MLGGDRQALARLFTVIERDTGRRHMSNFHGMFSLGSISGALSLTGALTLGLAPATGTLLMIAVIALANIAVMPGDTWNFVAWYRDVNPSNTSNFTDGLSVTFQ